MQDTEDFKAKENDRAELEDAFSEYMKLKVVKFLCEKYVIILE